MAQGRYTKFVLMIKWIRTSRLAIKKSLSVSSSQSERREKVQLAAFMENSRKLYTLKLKVRERKRVRQTYRDTRREKETHTRPPSHTRTHTQSETERERESV